MTTVLPRGAPRVKRLTTLLRFVLKRWARDTLNTHMPGIVETYDRDSRRARVIPAHRALMADKTYRQRPPIVNVPVLFPSFGGVTVEGDLAANDAYWMSFSQRGLRQFKDDLAVSDWDEERVFDMSSAVLHAGSRFLPDSVMLPAAGEFAMGSADGARRVRISGDEIGLSHDDGSVVRSVTLTDSRIEATDGTLSMTLDASTNVAELANGDRKVTAGGSEVLMTMGGTGNFLRIASTAVQIRFGGVTYRFAASPTGNFTPVP